MSIWSFKPFLIVILKLFLGKLGHTDYLMFMSYWIRYFTYVMAYRLDLYWASREIG